MNIIIMCLCLLLVNCFLAKDKINGISGTRLFLMECYNVQMLIELFCRKLYNDMNAVTKFSRLIEAIKQYTNIMLLKYLL